MKLLTSHFNHSQFQRALFSFYYVNSEKYSSRIIIYRKGLNKIKLYWFWRWRGFSIFKKLKTFQINISYTTRFHIEHDILFTHNECFCSLKTAFHNKVLQKYVQPFVVEKPKQLSTDELNSTLKNNKTFASTNCYENKSDYSCVYWNRWPRKLSLYATLTIIGIINKLEC